MLRACGAGAKGHSPDDVGMVSHSGHHARGSSDARILLAALSQCGAQLTRGALRELEFLLVLTSAPIVIAAEAEPARHSAGDRRADHGGAGSNERDPYVGGGHNQHVPRSLGVAGVDNRFPLGSRRWVHTRCMLSLREPRFGSSPSAGGGLEPLRTVLPRKWTLGCGLH